MNPDYEDNHIKIFNKDCRSMDELPDESVQCVVTSPPYFGLRKYSGEQELIWGDNHCEHQWQPYKRSAGGGHPAASAQVGATKADIQRIFDGQGAWCLLCGAWKGQLGLEPTMELYIQHLIEIMREIKRVLRKDGTFFLNIGDSYATHASGGKGYVHNFRPPEVVEKEGIDQPKPSARSMGLKEKDLCLIPFRVALATQEMGWWVRSLIIWSKRNTMPESVNGWRWERHKVKVGNRGRAQARQERHFQNHSGNKVIPDAIWQDCPGCPKCNANDGYVLRKGSWRPTESHEFILMLAKSDDYYCDRDAVRELSTERSSGNKERKYRRDYGGPEAHTGRQGFSIPYKPDGTGRNLRSVWTFPTVPFPSFKIDGRKLDHFAVFPEKLPGLCIKAATPEVGCCAKCGAPWARIVEKHGSGPARKERKNTAIRLTRIAGQEWQDWKNKNPDETIGWKPSCTCNATRVPSLVLDPMAGAGTTLLVAKKLNRFAVGYELSAEYCQLAGERCRQQVLV